MERNLKKLINKVSAFARRRDWEKFHSPKNLSMALAVEVAEIMEHLQWLTEDESRKPSPALRKELEDEIGDVQIYLARLADQLGIDPLSAAHKKIRANAKKYPVSKSKGNAKKYTELI